MKKVYNHLVDSEIISHLPLSKEEKVLTICPLHYSEKEANEIRYAARLLSSMRNMPFSTWSNSGGGVHCGFFFKRNADFKTITKYLKKNDLVVDNENITNKVCRLINIISEVDPDEKYKLYSFTI